MLSSNEDPQSPRKDVLQRRTAISKRAYLNQISFLFTSRFLSLNVFSYLAENNKRYYYYKHDYHEYIEVISDKLHSVLLERSVISGSAVTVEVFHCLLVVTLRKLRVTKTDISEPVVAVTGQDFLPRTARLLVLTEVVKTHCLVYDVTELCTLECCDRVLTAVKYIYNAVVRFDSSYICEQTLLVALAAVDEQQVAFVCILKDTSVCEVKESYRSVLININVCDL